MGIIAGIFLIFIGFTIIREANEQRKSGYVAMIHEDTHIEKSDDPERYKIVLTLKYIVGILSLVGGVAFPILYILET